VCVCVGLVGVAPHAVGSGNGNLKFMHKLQFN